MLQVTIGTRADEDAIIGVITMAFTTDPAGRQLYPDAATYLRYCPEFVRYYAGPAFDHGGAHFTPGYAGAALWLPPGIHGDDESMSDLLQRSVLDAAMRDELIAVYTAMHEHHPAEPHWFLPLIGVDLIHQGQGHGTALLQYGVQQCDRGGELAYLDSTNPKNIPLYERFGFEVLDTIQIGRHPPVYPMLRRPR